MTRRIRLLLLTLSTLFAFAASAQMFEPVKWSHEFKTDGQEAVLTLSATIDGGWHLYATELPIDDGPEPTQVNFTTLRGLEPVGELTADPEPIQMYEEMFNGDLRFWEGAVTLTQRFTITDPEAFGIEGDIVFMACNDENCLPPTTYTFSGGDP